MFGWRRRSEGFEWKEYVRTTILVRRADRQRRIDDARMEVLAKVKDTRDRGVAAGKAGVDAAAQHAASAAAATGNAFWQAACRFGAGLWSFIRTAGNAVAARLPARPALSLPQRQTASGDRSDRQRFLPDVPFRLPFNPRLIGGAALALALIVIGGPMLQNGGDVTAARFIPIVTSPIADKSASAISGRASVVSGDLLRVDGHLIRLTGVEQPDAKHPCFKQNGRRWNCNAAARAALDKIVAGRTVACTASGEDSEGRTLAACRAGDNDVAEALVRGGYVFAAPGFFASYASAEKEARAAKVGLWQGETVRPEEWRVQVWEEAKRSAPDGCPIKGFSRASDKMYAMPWQQAYDSAKMRTVKGDRWFCSEDDARAAGFKASSRS